MSRGTGASSASKGFQRTTRAAEVLTLLSLAFLAGCIPYKRHYWADAPVQQTAVAEDSHKKIRSDDLVRIHTTSGKTYRLRVHRPEADGFVGIASNKRKYRFYYKDLEWIEVQRGKWDYFVLGFTL